MLLDRSFRDRAQQRYDTNTRVHVAQVLPEEHVFTSVQTSQTCLLLLTPTQTKNRQSVEMRASPRPLSSA